MKSLTPKRIERWTAEHKAHLSAADLRIAKTAMLTLAISKQKAFKQSKALQAAARKDLQAFADLAAKVGRK